MADTVWLTYDELAERLGISRESARRTVIRKHWAKRKGNDGKARVGVPAESLSRDIPSDATGPVTGHDPRQDAGHVTGADTGHDPRHVAQAALLREKVAQLEGAIEGLKALVAESTKRADAAEMRIEEARQDIARWAGIAEELARRPSFPSWWPWRRHG